MILKQGQKKTHTALKTAGVLIATLGILGTLSATTAKAEEFSINSKDELNALIKEYIMENPQVIFDSVDLHRANQEKQDQKKAESKIEEYIDTLTASDAPSAGSDKPDITIVEFFDYNCGYCKRALPDIQKILSEDSNIRFVFKEMAILGPTSKTAALWSLAAHKQGKYFEYHVALMNLAGAKTEDTLMALAKKIGLDAEKMKEDANSEEIAAKLQEDMKIAREIGANGTPAFIIGSQFIPGYIGEAGLKAAIAEERAKADKKD